MLTPRSSRPRTALLLASYLLGVFGIIASHSGGDGDFSTDCQIEVAGIAPARDGSGDVWVGIKAGSNGGSVDGVLRLASDGSTVTSHSFDGSAEQNLVATLAAAVAPLNQGDVYVGGDFENRILRLNEDDTVGSGFAVGSGFDGRVNSIVPADDGSGAIYVGGDFERYDGALVGGLVRLGSNGSLDGSFVAIVQDVESVAPADAPLQGFVYSGGRTAPTPARWQNNGSLDTNFTPPTAEVFALAPAADASGDVYVGGNATTGVVRFNSNGSIDSGFDGSGFDASIGSIVLAGDATGDIYVGGDFANFDGSSANGIVRLDKTGTRRASFIVGDGFTDDSGSPGSVASIALADDGSTDIYAGGSFSLYDGRQSNGIARLNDNGSLDTGFAIRLPPGEQFCSGGDILIFD